MMWPFFAPVAIYIPIEMEPIPADELAIRRGTGVEAMVVFTSTHEGSPASG